MDQPNTNEHAAVYKHIQDCHPEGSQHQAWGFDDAGASVFLTSKYIKEMTKLTFQKAALELFWQQRETLGDHKQQLAFLNK